LKGFIISALIIGLLSMSMLLLAGGSYTLFSGHLLAARTIMLFFFLVFLALLFLATILFVPFEIFLLTELYYRLEEPAAFERKKMESLVIIRKFNRRGKAKKPRRLAKSFLVVIFLTGTVSVSLVSAYFFDDIFRPQQDIQIVAHRGGGNLAPENSLEGILVAADHGAKWSEIDVQRTKDGEYVINHDNSFTCVAGVPMSAQNMTLEEIRQIRIKNAFSRGSATAPVPTLREVLPASKGKIGLFLELKGKTADRQMADDVISMVKEFDMTEECVITTLDQNMAKYVKEKHPDIKVAYLYYFSLGKPERLPGDYLVMEEGQAMNFRILLARIEGKKTGIWTVNTEEAVQQAINKDVDILITDDVDMTRKVIKDRDNMSDFQLVILRVT
jgi:glycerophosphoryl diester phosphodiesterase